LHRREGSGEDIHRSAQKPRYLLIYYTIYFISGYKVLFCDYGNEDYVVEERIVLEKKLIPVEDVVDVNLQG
jgi:hypothetical protein